MNADVKKIGTSVVQGFSRLEKRQKVLIILLVAAVLFNVYYNRVFRSQSIALERARIDFDAVQNEIFRLKSQVPDVKKEDSVLQAEKQRLYRLREEEELLEGKFPSIRSIPELLGELAKESAGGDINFTSIRPKAATRKEAFAELAIEMVFDATYEDAVNYLNRLESRFDFLEVTDLVIENIEEGKSGSSQVTLTLSTLLSESGKPGEEVPEGVPVPPIDIKRDPLLSFVQPSREKKESEFILTGVISTGKEPTAIINGEVYRIGDSLGDKKVTEINKGGVIISNERKTVILTMEE